MASVSNRCSLNDSTSNTNVAMGCTAVGGSKEFGTSQTFNTQDTSMILLMKNLCHVVFIGDPIDSLLRR